MPVRNDAERTRVLRFERTDVIVALGLAGLVNMAMLAVAAKLFHGAGLTGVDTIQGAHAEFATSSAARRHSRSPSRCSRPAPPRRASAPTPGQVVMAGFVNLHISLLVRRT